MEEAEKTKVSRLAREIIVALPVELQLTIMATLAQDESRKTSIRVKAGQQTSMNNGVFYGNGNILGYNRVQTIIEGNKKKVDFYINSEQAKAVRLMA